jgi:hypothetical protein
LTSRGWKVLGGTAATALTLAMLAAAVVGLYLLGVQAILWISSVAR